MAPFGRITRHLGVALLLMVSPLALVAQETEDDGTDQSALIQAAQREFVYYNSQIELLEQRLADVEAQGERRVENARSQLQALEGDLLRVTSAVDRRLDDLRVIEEEALDAQEGGAALSSIISQGTARLREYDRPSFSESGELSPDAEISSGDRTTLELGYIFEESFQVLGELGSFRVEAGQFFLEDGEQVSGQIIHVGQIASFGTSDEGAGTLAPAGGGRLRLVDTETADVARQLQANPAGVATMPVFLYESLDELVETDQGSTLADTIEGGGIIGYVIIAIGLISVVLIIIRAMLLASVGKTTPAGLDRIFHLVQSKDFSTAQAEAQTQPGAMGRVLSATVRGLKVDPENIEDVISESVLNEQPRVDRFRSALSVFAAVAPLLGLLGTVTGMISTFEVITQFGTGDPRLLSGGISEALITTEFGLIVAIPVLLIGNLLSSWADRITSNTEVAALRVVNIAAGYESADARSTADARVSGNPPLAGEANV